MVPWIKSSSTKNAFPSNIDKDVGETLNEQGYICALVKR